MNRVLLLISLILTQIVSYGQSEWITMDMVHNNPGEPPTKTIFTNPQTLKGYGYDAQVFFLFDAAQFGVDWRVLDSRIFPEGTEEYEWVLQKRTSIHDRYVESKRVGNRVYCMLDMLVLPKNMVRLYADSLLNEKGKIDIQNTFTQRCVRLLVEQMFDAFPQLDGLIVRTGETYLDDAPYYVGNHPVQNDMERDHITLINILREEVCERLGKDVFYRTWDFGQFHSLPKWYLGITDKIEPHEHLYFSIKHTMTDFWRGAMTEGQQDYSSFDSYWINETSRLGNPFNPTIGIGRHKQIIEVQCQREYEGKAVHPNYIAAGVINGFEEYKTAGMQHPYCLDDLKNNPLVKGVWTWTRGGGWGGPYLKNEFWVELNAYVLTQWSKNRSRSENEIFADFCKIKRLRKKDVEKFHRLCMLSLDGVIMGQYSKYGATWANWTRDNKVFESNQMHYMRQIIAKGQQQKYSVEKHRAAAIWKEIAGIAEELHFKDNELAQYVRNSCKYAELKYRFFASAWDVQMAQQEKQPLHVIAELKRKADADWQEWTDFIDAKDMHEAAYQNNEMKMVQ